MTKVVLAIIACLAVVFTFATFPSEAYAKKRKSKPKPTPKITLTPTPTPTPAQTPTPTPMQSSQFIDFSNWKLTLPTGSPEKPTEIKYPTLSLYQMDPWFALLGNALRFRAPVNGVTTSGSSYPRSELREMTGNGANKASWASGTGIHTMFLDQAITALPKTKQHVVAGQIHDSLDDVIVIRLESSNLYVNVDGKNTFLLDPNYTLGKRFTVRFAVSGGKTAVYYNNNSTPAYILNKNYSGAYFKAGVYTQSNCTKEAANLCNDNNFGEVQIFNLNVTHT